MIPAITLALALAQQPADDAITSSTFEGLRFRSIGPALTSGRIVDIAVHPTDRKTYYVAAASGGVWKTTNSGTTWTPIFDDQPSYSIGCITIDPNNPLVVWVGTGENNSQRSVSYGDGVYKSLDGGKSWKNMGLQTSEHIAEIVVDPRDSKTVYVASQGPLWRSGGERGLYKTTDGGETWSLVLEISENTGVTDVVMDPRNPDVLVAASYQRRRHVWTLIDGGPESAIYKSTDAGASWAKVTKGLPTGDVGRIGLAQSPAEPDVVYAIIEATEDKGGVFRSLDGGWNWEKRGDHVSGSPQYYQELIADPLRAERVYSMDTWMMVSEDGGKTFARVGENFKHVDNHALYIDPEDTDYLLAGCDGGVYESFDRGATWHFKANLPITQFYRVEVDNDTPFYNVYGGTQDNFSLGGPSRTTTAHGIINADWFVTRGGDGFETVIDPENPDILYAQSQHGGLVRFDRKSGEETFIQPQPGAGESELKWNWDSPIIISPHSPTRLYFAANRLFRSEDRGDSWRPVSPDLSAGIDRNALEVMGKVWSVDAVAKNNSTSMYGSIVSLSESPLVEGLIYVGTDDGLIQTTANGGADWFRTELPREVPERTYVSRLAASVHDTDTLYAAFDNHKMGDFKPYLFKSADRGANFVSISGNLPGNGSVYTVVEDHENPNLLFAGTEFGVYFTVDGGAQWIELSGGLPTISVRDIAIQRRENDIVLGTFGRGFYILDDYSPLRRSGAESLRSEALLFPVKRTWMYMESTPLGLRGKSFQGDSFYTADNPPFGAVFTYYLRDELKTRKKRRQDEEKRIEGEGGTIRYPSWDALRAEDRETEPAIFLTVRDGEGNVVRRLEGPESKGFHRVAWDLRFPDSRPTRLKETPPDNPFASPPQGPMVVPGTYEVSLSKRVGGVVTPLGEPQRFETVALGTATLPAEDKAALLAFQQETAALQRAVLGAVRAVENTRERLDYIEKAVLQAPEADPSLLDETRALEDRLYDIDVALSGDDTIESRAEPAPLGILERVQDIVSAQWQSTSAPTETSRANYRIAADAFEPVLEDLRTLIDIDVRALEQKLDVADAPWTPGRLPSWRRR
ncbi:MAG TPA: glycosyl hydrolase [Vicinamibacteria bacterium]|nr:glycosyl hydrolase [Vicinamibacteria bacterium]